MPQKKFDWWLTGFCASRIFNGFVFMTYAVALPVLQQEWAMSATQAGSISSGFQLGYAVSLVFFSSLADRISARTVYLGSLFVSGVCSLAFAAAIAPLAFGAVLDLSNPMVNGQRPYDTWGWAFSLLGVGGLGAVWTIYRTGDKPKAKSGLLESKNILAKGNKKS